MKKKTETTKDYVLIEYYSSITKQKMTMRIDHMIVGKQLHSSTDVQFTPKPTIEKSVVQDDPFRILSTLLHKMDFFGEDTKAVN